MIELGNVYNMDCLDGMRMIPDKSIDLVFTDPPYGIGESAKHNNRRGKNGSTPTDFGCDEWDKSIPSSEFFDEMFRISKNQIIFGGNYFVEHLKNSSCWIVWDKKNDGTDFADCELAWTSFKSATRIFRYLWNGMIQENMGKNKEKRVHLTQKPIMLATWVLDNYTKKGDSICDPFCGSGTFLKAAQEMGRKYIGFEKLKKYYDISIDRLQSVPLLIP